MSFKIRKGIRTTVTMELVAGRSETVPGQYAIECKSYLPGATVPDNVAPWVIEKYKAGDPYTRNLLETDENGVPEVLDLEGLPEVQGDVLVPEQPKVEVPAPAAPEPQSTQDGDVDYESMKKSELVAEADRRSLTVVRSDGKEGEPLASDYVTALQQSDAKVQPETPTVEDNPFAA